MNNNRVVCPWLNTKDTPLDSLPNNISILYLFSYFTDRKLSRVQKPQMFLN